MNYVAKAAFKSYAGNVKDRVTGGNNEEGENKEDTAGGIKWIDFNYPPCIRVIHFDPYHDDIPKRCRSIIVYIYNTHRFALLIQFTNICTNIALTSMQVVSYSGIILSILQFIIGVIFSAATVYQAYRGLGGELRKNILYFKILQFVEMIFAIVFFSAESGNVHGYAGLNDSSMTSVTSAWMPISAAESTCWLFAFLMSIVNVIRFQIYPGHSRARRYEELHGGGAGGKPSKRVYDRYNLDDIEPERGDGDDEKNISGSSKKKVKFAEAVDAEDAEDDTGRKSMAEV